MQFGDAGVALLESLLGACLGITGGFQFGDSVVGLLGGLLLLGLGGFQLLVGFFQTGGEVVRLLGGGGLRLFGLGPRRGGFGSGCLGVPQLLGS